MLLIYVLCKFLVFVVIENMEVVMITARMEICETKNSQVGLFRLQNMEKDNKLIFVLKTSIINYKINITHQGVNEKNKKDKYQHIKLEHSLSMIFLLEKYLSSGITLRN